MESGRKDFANMTCSKLRLGPQHVVHYLGVRRFWGWNILEILMIKKNMGWVEMMKVIPNYPAILWIMDIAGRNSFSVFIYWVFFHSVTLYYLCSTFFLLPFNNRSRVFLNHTAFADVLCILCKYSMNAENLPNCGIRKSRSYFCRRDELQFLNNSTKYYKQHKYRCKRFFKMVFKYLYYKNCLKEGPEP